LLLGDEGIDSATWLASSASLAALRAAVLAAAVELVATESAGIGRGEVRRAGIPSMLATDELPAVGELIPLEFETLAAPPCPTFTFAEAVEEAIADCTADGAPPRRAVSVPASASTLLGVGISGLEFLCAITLLLPGSTALEDCVEDN
jgi:hypothetical protein